MPYQNHPNCFLLQQPLLDMQKDDKRIAPCPKIIIVLVRILAPSTVIAIGTAIYFPSKKVFRS